MKRMGHEAAESAQHKAGEGGRFRHVGGTAMAMVLVASGLAAETRVQGCALVAGVLPDGCYQANEGQVIRRETAANTEGDDASPPGAMMKPHRWPCSAQPSGRQGQNWMART